MLKKYTHILLLRLSRMAKKKKKLLSQFSGIPSEALLLIEDSPTYRETRRNSPRGILDELPRISGPRIATYGSMAFVPQSAWIQTGTVRDNVLFGKDMDRALYEQVVEACALHRDIKSWADGDLCVVGERIQMARPLYSNSDLYLLDDPFSAVDAHTGAHMFQKCLKENLHGKTVVLVTHQMEFISGSNLVLVVNDGRVVESGRYEDLISNPDGQLAKQMEAHNQYINQVKLPYLTDDTEISEEMQSASDKMNWNVYSTFVTAAYKGALVAPIILCHVLFQLLQMGSNYWISSATGQGAFITKNFDLLSGGSSLFILGRAVLLSTVAIETSQRLFLGMISSVFRAPFSFFKSTPSSWILSRSSTDQNRVDIDIPYRLDISTVGLQDLRTRLSIIPQDPILFQGTLRKNIDPLQEHPDHEIWEVLRKSHLSQLEGQDERLLDAPVAEDGGNWSVSERQLICLARVLLQRTRILMLDESTASLDALKEQPVLNLLQEETNGCTVIAVAHRLTTVVDADLVMVLGEGKNGDNLSSL